MSAVKKILLLLAMLLIFSGCAQAQPQSTLPASVAQVTPLRPAAVTEPGEPQEQTEQSDAQAQTLPSDPVEELVQQELAVLPEEPAVPLGLTAQASGELVAQNEQAVIDYSHTADGYVMVKYLAETDQRLKAQVKGPTTTYTYNLSPGKWAVFPLSDGEGDYQVCVYENISGTKYALALSERMEVALEDPFAPFLYSNQYVNYEEAPSSVQKAAQLCQGAENLEKVERIYQFVVEGMRYDTQLAATVKSGYIPVLDGVLANMQGICFDYAALMAGMLRSQGVPCKLVVGYAGDVYHAWISVWTEQTGWIEGIVFFDGTSWKRMDPTFASSAQNSPDILNYISNDTNYTVKYIY